MVALTLGNQKKRLVGDPGVREGDRCRWEGETGSQCHMADFLSKSCIDLEARL